jgi:hypothetical protein
LVLPPCATVSDPVFVCPDLFSILQPKDSLSCYFVSKRAAGCSSQPRASVISHEFLQRVAAGESSDWDIFYRLIFTGRRFHRCRDLLLDCLARSASQIRVCLGSARGSSLRPIFDLFMLVSSGARARASALFFRFPRVLLLKAPDFSYLGYLGEQLQVSPGGRSSL